MVELACAALYPTVMSALERSPASPRTLTTRRGRARQPLSELLNQAKDQSLDHVFVLTTQSTHWFLEQGSKQPVWNSCCRKTTQLATQRMVLRRAVDQPRGGGKPPALTSSESSMPQYRSRTSTVRPQQQCTPRGGPPACRMRTLKSRLSRRSIPCPVCARTCISGSWAVGSAEIEAAGGVAKEFNTIAVDDGIAMDTTACFTACPRGPDRRFG